jgi:hypothetical protein
MHTKWVAFGHAQENRRILRSMRGRILVTEFKTTLHFLVNLLNEISRDTTDVQPCGRVFVFCPQIVDNLQCLLKTLQVRFLHVSKHRPR